MTDDTATVETATVDNAVDSNDARDKPLVESDTISQFAAQYALLLNTLGGPETQADAGAIYTHLRENPQEAQANSPERVSWLTTLNSKLKGLAANAVGAFVQQLTDNTTMTQSQAVQGLAVNAQKFSDREMTNMIKMANLQANMQQASAAPAQPQQSVPVTPPQTVGDPAVDAAINRAHFATHKKEQERMDAMKKELQQYSAVIDATFAKMDAVAPGWRDNIIDHGTPSPTRVSSEFIKETLLEKRAKNLIATSTNNNHWIEQKLEEKDSTAVLNETSPEVFIHFLKSAKIDMQQPDPMKLMSAVESATSGYGLEHAAEEFHMANAARPFINDILAVLPDAKMRERVVGDPDKLEENLGWLGGNLSGRDHANAYRGNEGKETRLQRVQKQADSVTAKHEYFKALSLADKKVVLEEARLGSVAGAIRSETSEHFNPISTLSAVLDKLMKEDVTLGDLQKTHSAQYKLFEQQDAMAAQQAQNGGAQLSVNPAHIAPGTAHSQLVKPVVDANNNLQPVVGGFTDKLNQQGHAPNNAQYLN